MGLTHAGWQPGRYPFDHVGQHLYIDGGSTTTEQKVRMYLEEIRDVYLLYEGAETRKTTHITEFGWSTKDLSQELQAENLVIAFDTFRQVGYVARAYWFHAQDVPEAGLFFGLTEASGKKKKAFEVYLDVAAYDSPADDAAPVNQHVRPGAPPRRAAATGPPPEPATGESRVRASDQDASGGPESPAAARSTTLTIQP
jgi:hypothetical protein